MQQQNVGFDAEVITVDDYGLIQTVATVLIAPVVIFLIAYNVKGLNAVADDQARKQREENKVTNPFAEDEIFEGKRNSDGRRGGETDDKGHDDGADVRETQT